MSPFGSPSDSDWVIKFLNFCVYKSVVSPLVSELNKQHFLNVNFGTVQVKEELCLGM